ncbi:recombinase family protein, partial [Frankia sp. AgB1.8]|uniref:recombinase family protein n=1 Tax=Frankia sp. AgB1.8 TaxID=2792839 RepID=UPI00193421EE
PTDSLVIHRRSPAADWFRLDIGVSLGGYYSNVIAEHVIRRFEQKLADGEWPGKAPIGYRNIVVGFTSKNEPIKSIALDPERWELVKKALEMRADGFSYGYITRYLRSMGLRSTVKGRPIAKRQVEHLLQNPFYAGNMRYSGQSYPHKYERLIEPWLWRKIQEVDQRRSTGRTKHLGKEYLYRDLVRCATCRYTVSTDGPKKGGNYYLKCTEYGGAHGAKRLNQKRIDAQVSAVFQSIHIPQDILPGLVDELRRSAPYDRELRGANVRKLAAEHDRLGEEMKDMYRDRNRFKLKPELFGELIDEMTGRQAELMSEIENQQDGQERFVVSSARILELASRASPLFMSDAVRISQKRRLLNVTLSNLRVADETLLFELNEPFDAVSHALKMNSWGELLDEFRTQYYHTICSIDVNNLLLGGLS